MKGSAPSAPDPFKTADAQWGYAKKAINYAADVNAVNQYSPWGSTTFKKNAQGVPIKQTVSLSPDMQTYFDTSNATRNALAGTAQDVYSKPWQVPDTAANEKTVADALYARKLGLVQPQFDEQRRQMMSTLSDRGIPIGSEVWNNETGRYEKNYGDTLAGIAQDATLAAGNEQDRLIRNSMAERAQPLNELSSFLSGSPVQQPNFQQQPGYSAQAPDIASMINDNYKTALQQYNTQQGSFWNGLFGLGSAWLSSDRRLKKDVERVGVSDSGFNLYAFHYRDDPEDSPRRIGLMADEVRRGRPEAVRRDARGFDAVNYDLALEAA